MWGYCLRTQRTSAAWHKIATFEWTDKQGQIPPGSGNNMETDWYSQDTIEKEHFPTSSGGDILGPLAKAL